MSLPKCKCGRRAYQVPEAVNPSNMILACTGCLWSVDKCKCEKVDA